MAFNDLNALFINCTLKRSPEPSHTNRLINVNDRIAFWRGVEVS